MAAKKKTAKAKKAAPAKAKKAAPAKGPAKGLYGDISKATGVVATAKETLVDWAGRVCDAVSKKTDDEYAAMPEPVQKWFDVAVDAINTSKTDDIPAVSGFPEDSAPVAGADAKPAATKGKKVAEKKAAEKTEKKGKKKANGEQGTLPGINAGGKARIDGVAFRMRQQVVNNPDIGFEDAVKAASAKGSKIKAERGNNAWNAFFNAVQTMRIARSEGVLRK